MVRRGFGSRYRFPGLSGAYIAAVVPVSLSGLVSVRVALKSAPSRHARPLSENVKGGGGIFPAFSRAVYHNVMRPDLMRPYFARVLGR